MEEKINYMKDVIYQNRKKKHLTQEQLADLLNVSNKTVSKWERGIGYPDVQMIPTLASILDISIQDLFNTEDLKPESVEKYNTSIIVKYKQYMILSFILFLISPILYLISAFVLESHMMVIVSILIGILFIIFSITNVIMQSIKMYDFAVHNYRNEKYIKIFKNYLLTFGFLLFIPSILIVILFKNPFIAIIMATVVYFLFLSIPIFVIYCLNVNVRKKKSIVFGILTIALFIAGFILMICIEKIPYVLLYISSQLVNYFTLFISKDIDK